MTQGLTRPDPNIVTARIVWPVAAILVAMLALGMAGLAWTGQRTNEQALERQGSNLGTALRIAEAQTLMRLQRVAMSPAAMAALQHPMSAEAAQHAIGMVLEDGFGFDRSFVLTPEGLLVTGRIAGEPADQRRLAPLMPLLQPTLAGLRDRLARRALRRPAESRAEAAGDGLAQDVAELGEVRLVFDGERAVIVAAMAMERPGSGALGVMTALATRPLTRDVLDEMALAIGNTTLTVTRAGGPAPDAALPLLDASGKVMAWLAWEPDRPGDSVLRSVLPVVLLAVSGIGLFSGFMFAHVRRVTIDLVAREAQATHLALHDPLSGLPNRAFFARRLDIELRRLRDGHDGIAVMLLDLDRFKEINDTYGHAAGDMVIGETAKRLQEALRGSDALARLGGDEFAIIQTGVRSPRDCVSLARRVLEGVREPIQMGEAQVFVGVSIGIALAPQNSQDRDTLLKQADGALYRAKHDGRNRYSFFELGLDALQRRRAAVEEDLRGAIERNELDIVYQPQFSADGRIIQGVEALVRWTHPVHGPMAPSDFIPVAEERGLIGALGEWVLRRACRDGRDWPVTVAVNVSPIQFRQRDFVRSVSRIVTEEGIDPARVELELTEGVIVDDAETAEEAMMELRSMGIRFALDDFGTGYSSLIYLRRFAFDKIKIDRSFLESMESTGESAILVHSVVHLGRALGLKVVAEGVETAEQQRFLQAVGCHQLQGYLFCKPVSAGTIASLLAHMGEDGGFARAMAVA